MDFRTKVPPRPWLKLCQTFHMPSLIMVWGWSFFQHVQKSVRLSCIKQNAGISFCGNSDTQTFMWLQVWLQVILLLASSGNRSQNTEKEKLQEAGSEILGILPRTPKKGQALSWDGQGCLWPIFILPKLVDFVFIAQRGRKPPGCAL